ncbi:MAG: hypothetical protein A4E48_01319 [Methanosaeta sp. PtaU1.Bin060]|nr:MAG: hypothetical protein A4E48_01319 [Methanosaeta sp. PtaU1.Bin060]
MGDAGGAQVRPGGPSASPQARDLKFLGSGARAKQEVEKEFDLKPEQAEYHLALLEKALVVEGSEGIYGITATGRLYLEKVEARR